MSEFALILGLLAGVACLIALADRLKIAYPIVLVIAGLALGFIPVLPNVVLEPEIVFLLFLPPLLYWDAVRTSWRDFRTNLTPIVSLAVGLVVATTVGVALVAHYLIDLSWGVAFVLGAIVSATDAVAAGSIVSRLGVPRRVVAILEGESLVNDATALVVYGTAVGAVVAGTFSFWSAARDFVWAGGGGILFGILTGWIVMHLRRPLTDVRLEATLALLTPFAAYLPADHFGASGVLAAVAAGLYLGRHSPVTVSSAVRLRSDAIWELGTFLLNGLAFILIGLVFQEILHDLSARSIPILLAEVALVGSTVIVARLVWVYPATAIARKMGQRSGGLIPSLSRAESTVVGWAGMRGVIALATALALPKDTDIGPFPDRDLILFLTFAVILVTLVGQGLTLSPLIRRLHLVEDAPAHREEDRARSAAARAAISQLDRLTPQDADAADAIAGLRDRYVRRLSHLAGHADERDDTWLRAVRDLRISLLDIERQTIIGLRDRGVVGEDVLRRLQRELDLEEVHLDARLVEGSPSRENEESRFQLG